MRLTFNEFKTRVREFWEKELKAMGYESPYFDNNSYGDNLDYWASFTRRDYKRNRRAYTQNLNYCGGEIPFEINEHFYEWEDIPECYNVPRLESMPEQVPMFIYGKWKRFGDALNALKKGDSLNGRKYVELYY